MHSAFSIMLAAPRLARPYRLSSPKAAARLARRRLRLACSGMPRLPTRGSGSPGRNAHQARWRWRPAAVERLARRRRHALPCDPAAAAPHVARRWLRFDASPSGDVTARTAAVVLHLTGGGQGCSNRESRESRGAKKRRFAPNREALNKIPNRPNRYLMTSAV